MHTCVCACVCIYSESENEETMKKFLKSHILLSSHSGAIKKTKVE